MQDDEEDPLVAVRGLERGVESTVRKASSQWSLCGRTDINYRVKSLQCARLAREQEQKRKRAHLTLRTMSMRRGTRRSKSNRLDKMPSCCTIAVRIRCPSSLVCFPRSMIEPLPAVVVSIAARPVMAASKIGYNVSSMLPASSAYLRRSASTEGDGGESKEIQRWA